MENKQFEDWIEAKIKENKVDKNNPEEMRKLFKKLKKELDSERVELESSKIGIVLAYYYGKIKSYLKYTWVFVSAFLKIPIYIASILTLTILYIFNIPSVRTLMNNVIQRKYTDEEESAIFEVHERYTDHIAIIFYLVLLAWLIL